MPAKRPLREERVFRACQGRFPGLVLSLIGVRAIVEVPWGDVPRRMRSSYSGWVLDACVVFLMAILWGGGCGPRVAHEKMRHETAPTEKGLGVAEEPRPPEPPKEVDVVRVALHAYRMPVRCSQGPVEIRIPAVGALYSERFVIVACGPRPLKGQYTLNGGGFGLGGRFGPERPENEACIPRPDEKPRQPLVQGKREKQEHKTRRNDSLGPQHGEGVAPGEGAQTLRPIPVEWKGGEPCSVRTRILDHRFTSRDGRPLHPGTPMELRIWSHEPNDWDGVTLVVEQRSVPSEFPPSQWEEYLRRLDAYWKEYSLYLERLPVCGTKEAEKAPRCVVRETGSGEDVHVIPPPPPPQAEEQPPRPSDNAEWVPGFWHYDRDRRKFVWSPGWWRVPKSDITAERTVRAPGPPPPPRIETHAHEERPVPQAVWVPGHWAYDGRHWVWVKGAFRIPPRPGMRWRPPEWRIIPSGAVFIPGDWEPVP